MKYAQKINGFIVHFNGGFEMKSEAQKKAQQKYLNKLRNDKKFQFSVTIDRCYKKIIEDYNIKHRCDKTKLLIYMLNYCIMDNINFNNYLDMQIKTDSEKQQTGSGDAENN